MSEKKYEGGFVWYNKGRIDGCYSAVRLDKNDWECAGFAYENAGTIRRCFSRSTVPAKNKENKKKKSLDGFCVADSGTIEESFFLVKDKDELKDYRDGKLGLDVDRADPKSLKEDRKWDFMLFEEKNASEMDFRKKTWHTAPGGAKADYIKIRSKKDLLRVIDRINSGDAQAARGRYILTRDLDFHGKKIEPIGRDKDTPFFGTFDGGGHCVRGFELEGKGRDEVGFFGHLYGKVTNLRIDCVVEGLDCPLASAFCAMNFGEIYCCEAVCAVYGTRDVGAFVGENYGQIRWCGVSGKSRVAAVWWPWLLPFIPLLLLALCPLIYPIQEPPEYEPIIADSALIPNTGIEEFVRTNDNKLSFTVPEEIRISAGTLTAVIEDDDYVIVNPDRGANYDFVAVIYMKNSAGKDVEVYRSGLIPVGYHIDSITLTPPDGIQLGPGLYDAEVAFDFYHHETGEKGMIDSSLPITLRIE